MELKKTVKYDIKAKGLKVFGGQVVDSTGEVIDLIALFSKAYEDSEFDLSTTTKSEETYDLGVIV